MKYYATIKSTAETQKIYVDGKSYFICTPDRMNEYYGDPEQYIKRVLKRSKQLNIKVVIER